MWKNLFSLKVVLSIPRPPLRGKSTIALNLREMGGSVIVASRMGTIQGELTMVKMTVAMVTGFFPIEI